MNKLISSGLFGGGLTAIETPELIRRYNECLQDLGIEPTKLKKIQVDGIGWSPEIAGEREDNYYLSHGAVNQLAIILTPDQSFKPIFFPVHSFDREMLNRYYETYQQQIADVTQTTPIWLDLDKDMSDYRSPFDLLYITYITIYSHAEKLLEAAAEQAKLVAQFKSEGNAWMDEKLRLDIIKSVQGYGDLRYRNLTIPPLRFDDVKHFYSEVFGGVYVFRGFQQGNVLVVRDGRRTKQGTQIDIYHINNKDLLERLFYEEMIRIDFDWYQKNLDVLKHRKMCIATEHICAADEKVVIDQLNSVQFKQRLRAVQGNLPDTYFELERVIKQLEQGATPEINTSATDLWFALLHPNYDALTKLQVKLVWRLLCDINPLDPLRLYIADKNTFFKIYRQWPESKQQWAINLIKQRYSPKMDRKRIQ